MLPNTLKILLVALSQDRTVSHCVSCSILTVLIKYSYCFPLLVTFPVLNAGGRPRARSEASLTTSRFFTKLWAVIELLFYCQDFGSALKKPWSTFRSWSTVQESFPTTSTSETLSVRREESVAENFIALLGVTHECLSHCRFSLRGTESLKNDKETKRSDKYQIYTEKPAQTQQVHQTQTYLQLYKILKKDHNAL